MQIPTLGREDHEVKLISSKVKLISSKVKLISSKWNFKYGLDMTKTSSENVDASDC